MTKQLILHFENASAMCLYDFEMSGQLSDGKYENSRPFDHWKWIGEVKNMVVDGTTGIEGYSIYRPNYFGSFSKRYNLNEWFTYINKWRKKQIDDNMWATRIIAYGKFGKIYSNLTFEELKKFNYVSVLLEDLQMMIENGINDPEELFIKITDFSKYEWRRDYYESAKDYITLDFIKKFVELDYDINECKKDVKSMEQTINSVYQA